MTMSTWRLGSLDVQGLRGPFHGIRITLILTAWRALAVIAADCSGAISHIFLDRPLEIDRAAGCLDLDAYPVSCKGDRGPLPGRSHFRATTVGSVA